MTNSRLVFSQSVARKKLSYSSEFKIITIKNKGKGVHGAIITGFDSTLADCVIVFPADDTYNAPILDKMYDKFSVTYGNFIQGLLARDGDEFRVYVVTIAPDNKDHICWPRILVDDK